MTNIGKTLITGVLLVELGFASYLLFPKGDQSTPEADAGMGNSAVTAGVDSRFATAHVTAGSVVGAAPPARSTSSIATAPQPSPARKVVPDPVPAARTVAQAPPSETQSHQQPPHTLA